MAGKEHWKEEPEEHDYPAARDYLSLLVPEPVADEIVLVLRHAPLAHRKARDLLRASALLLLPADNRHVVRDLDKVRAGKALSPVLLVRGQLRSNLPLVVADGYHRICASHHLDEDADIPCRIADFPER